MKGWRAVAVFDEVKLVFGFNKIKIGVA